MTEPPEDSDLPESPRSTAARKSSAALARLHWYSRIPEGGRSFFWALYFGVFVVAAVAGIVIALVQMHQDPHRLMHNPISSILILVTGTTGEMWCFHRNLGIYMLGKPGKEYARWGIYVAGGALTLSFLLAVGIVVVYMMQ